MREVNLKTIDLNLLITLKALLDEKHVTRAAQRIGLSQPAMSRALFRLRTLFKDALLVKTIHGLCLTPRANELYQPLNNILDHIHQLVSNQTFKPAEIEREIIIATRDYETTVIMPSIIKIVNQEAPGITFRIISLMGDDLRPLERQEVDFVIAGSESKASTLCRYILYKENFSCLLSKENAITQDDFTLNRYLALKHCSININNVGHGIVDTTLKKKNLKRQIAVRIPHFVAAAFVVGKSDLVITLPSRLANLLYQQKNHVLLNPPLKLPSFPIYLYWHLCHQQSPIHVWLRKIFKETCESLTSVGNLPTIL